MFWSDNGRIADQASACQSIILFDALTTRQQEIRKAGKGLDLLLTLGIIEGGEIEAAQSRHATIERETGAMLSSVTAHMQGSNAFSVPQGTNANDNPG